MEEDSSSDGPRRTMARGPDFLPYALPAPPSPPQFGFPATGGSAPEPAASGLDLAKVAAAAAAVGVGAFLLVSLLGGLHWWGAAVAILAAGVALVAGHQAVRARPGALRVARAAQVAGSVAAVLALLTALFAHGGSDPGAQTLTPSPSDLATPPQATAPDPALPPSEQPLPSDPALPSLPVLPPGPTGAPSAPGSLPSNQPPQDPGPPVSADPTAKGTLTGRVLDAGGAPIPGATIVLTRSTPGDTSNAPGCPLTVKATTNAQGTYTVQLCQLGDNLGYTARISAAGKSAAANLYINSGRTTTYSVQLDVPPTKHS